MLRILTGGCPSVQTTRHLQLARVTCLSYLYLRMSSKDPDEYGGGLLDSANVLISLASLFRSRDDSFWEVYSCSVCHTPMQSVACDKLHNYYLLNQWCDLSWGATICKHVSQALLLTGSWL